VRERVDSAVNAAKGIESHLSNGVAEETFDPRIRCLKLESGVQFGKRSVRVDFAGFVMGNRISSPAETTELPDAFLWVVSSFLASGVLLRHQGEELLEGCEAL
jgi:hypothetical protein